MLTTAKALSQLKEDLNTYILPAILVQGVILISIKDYILSLLKLLEKDGIGRTMFSLDYIAP